MRRPTTAPRVHLSARITEECLREIQREAERLERSQTWMIEEAWRLARQQIAQYPDPRGARTACPAT